MTKATAPKIKNKTTVSIDIILMHNRYFFTYKYRNREALRLLNMQKPNLSERTVDFNGREIKVSNWWSWKMDGAADLYLDGEHLDQNTDKIATGRKVLLSKYDVSEDIKSIEVYASFFFKLKLKILVNGNIIYQD